MPVPVGQIIDERLSRWSKCLRGDNATPIILLGVGHDQNSGTLVVITVEEPEMSKAAICEFLRAAIKRIEVA